VEIELKKALARRQKQTVVDPGRVPSAVLIPIYKKDGQYYLLFIRRTMTVKTHRGQISFPGGGWDEEDAGLRDTALREAREEVGLRSKDVTILGELDDAITTTSNYIVTPFVGMIPYPYRFTREKREVAGLIRVPLAALLNEDTKRLYVEVYKGKKTASFAYYYRDKVIWGATARILEKLLDVIRRLPPEENRNE
jgi:8-oxo-dGTP pyrophosphatase MutT (NUDIX family)